MSQTQISAYISDDTKAELESYVKQRGVKKAHVIEEALMHHLQALREIPEDVIIPVRLVLSDRAMKNVLRLMAADDAPTQELQALLRG